jgi:hypothetical protein
MANLSVGRIDSIQLKLSFKNILILQNKLLILRNWQYLNYFRVYK